MPQLPAILITITAVTLGCSSLSLIGSGLTLICYAILPFDYHFRHILILNLTAADFLYSVNHTVGGVYILKQKEELTPGRGCTIQGLVDQITVQAIDCAVLAISVATVYTVTRRRIPASRSRWGRWRVLLICCSIWVVPLFTGFLGFAMNWYGPASGNWCWVKRDPKYLRFLFLYIWKYLFMITEISLYVYLHFFLRRHYRKMGALEITNIDSFAGNSHSHSSNDKDPAVDRPSQSKTRELPSRGNPMASSSRVRIEVSSGPPSWSLARITGLRKTQQSSSSSDNPQYQSVQKILLLNAYPLAYIILWIPGVVNRSIEATGHTSHIAQLFQASTQLVGLANALTFGWNERVVKQLKKRFAG